MDKKHVERRKAFILSDRSLPPEKVVNLSSGLYVYVTGKPTSALLAVNNTLSAHKHTRMCIVAHVLT